MSCQKNLEWSAFGACYPDTICIDGYLWDLDSCDDAQETLSNGGCIPCPVCQPDAFSQYAIDEYQVPVWKHNGRDLPRGISLKWHDGRPLRITAIHPKLGECDIILRELTEAEAADTSYMPWTESLTPDHESENEHE